MAGIQKRLQFIFFSEEGNMEGLIPVLDTPGYVVNYLAFIRNYPGISQCI
jgi:hypothetical protein